MSTGFVQVTIRAEPALNEHLVGILSQIGFEGFWEDEENLLCFMKRERWSEALEEEVGRMMRLVSSTSKNPQPTFTVSFLMERNWNKAWEKTIKPIHVSKRIIIRPSWQKVRARHDQIVLVIDPKMSFGTGYHESTRLILNLLEKHLRPGMSLLDVGTGSGILAIAAIRLGASSALGVDIDEWAYRNALENSARNGVEGNIVILMGDLGIVPHEKVDIITANIQRDVLEELLDDMASRLRPNGILLLSGLLQPDVAPFSSALARRGLVIFDSLAENGWAALAAFRKPS